MSKIFLLAILILAILLRSGSFGYQAISIVSVIGVWYLVGTLFPKKKYFKELAVLTLAISQWHLSLSSYPLRISSTILLVILGISVLSKVLKKQWLLLSVAILILIGNQIISPLVPNLNHAQDVVWLTDEQRREHGNQYNGFFALAFHNKAVNYSLSFLEHWGEHFSLDFLFISRSTSLIFLLDILFLLVGFFNILKLGEWDKWGVILLWLALAPISSALSFGPPDSEKAALMIIPLVLISSFGAFNLLKKVKYFFQK